MKHNSSLSRNQRRTEQIVVAAVLILYFLLQLPTLANVPWDEYNSWRQSDTYSIAVNYAQYNMNPLRPQFNYDGVSDIYVQLELQIVPFLAAIIFKCFHLTTPFVPRLIGLLFFLGSAVFVYRIARKFASFLPAAAGLLIYLFLPASLLYARAIMPESCALFFYCGSVWFLLRWYDEDHVPSVYLSAIFTALAIVEKTPTIFVGLLVLAVFWWKLKLNCFKSKEFYSFGIISLGFPLVYYLYASSVATMNYVDNIASKHILTDKLFSLFTPAAISFFRRDIPYYFSWIAVLAALIGLVVSICRKTHFLTVWTIAFLAEWATIAAIIKFGYYLVFMAPIIAVLCALLINVLFKKQRVAGVCLGVLLVLGLSYTSIPSWQAAMSGSLAVQSVAELIDQVTDQSDTIAVANINPVYLNAANRRGYRANIQYHDYIPIGPEAETQYYIDMGVSYFVVVSQWIEQDYTGEYMAYVRDTFPVAAENEDCIIYKMR